MSFSESTTPSEYNRENERKSSCQVFTTYFQIAAITLQFSKNDGIGYCNMSKSFYIIMSHI